MMNDRRGPGQPTTLEGLCAACRHGEPIVSAKGSHFLLCGRSRFDPAFPKYPRLPVVTCAGFEQADWQEVE